MSRASDLAGYRILVTRPAARAAALGDLLEQSGAMIVRYPVLVTRPVDDPIPLREAMQQADIAVFVSVSAVEALGYEQGETSSAQSLLRAGLRIAAVGSATARALESVGLRVTFQPGEGVGSEGLLSTIRDEQLRGLKVALFAAERGRPLLAEAFSRRGAQVMRVLAYHRSVNCDLAPSILDTFLLNAHRVAVLTSVEGVEALLQTAHPSTHPALLETDLVVVSQRVGAACRSLGFRARIGVSDGISDQAIVSAVQVIAAAPAAE